MKLRHILAATSAATLSYLLVSNREKIAEQTKETLELTKKAQSEYQAIQTHVQTIQENTAVLKEVFKDLQYNFRVYQQSIAGNLAEINKTLDKSTPETPD